MTGPARQVVIGVGNEFRRDDGIGPEVVTRLRAQAAGPVQLLVCDGEPARMIEAWAGASLAVVVDAVLASPPPPAPHPPPRPSPFPPSLPPFPGRLHRIELDRADGWDISPVSSHGLSLGDAIGLARALDRMPERLILHAVEAADFRLGLGLTPAVAAAVAPLVAAVLRDLG
jgi:hydrogenase maturation protease